MNAWPLLSRGGSECFGEYIELLRYIVNLSMPVSKKGPVKGHKATRGFRRQGAAGTFLWFFTL